MNCEMNHIIDVVVPRLVTKRDRDARRGAPCFQQFGPQLLSTNRSESPISTEETLFGLAKVD
jgi:hypothetical protein